VTALRARLAQMGEVARAATPGPWRSAWPDPTPMDALGSGDLQTIVASTSDAVEGEMARQVVGMIAFQEIVVACRENDAAHIATFSPDVAAALVAVADALRNAYDVGAVAEWIDVEGDGPKAALDALAAALGVSR